MPKIDPTRLIRLTRKTTNKIENAIILLVDQLETFKSLHSSEPITRVVLDNDALTASLLKNDNLLESTTFVRVNESMRLDYEEEGIEYLAKLTALTKLLKQMAVSEAAILKSKSAAEDPTPLQKSMNTLYRTLSLVTIRELNSFWLSDAATYELMRKTIQVAGELNSDPSNQSTLAELINLQSTMPPLPKWLKINLSVSLVISIALGAMLFTPFSSGIVLGFAIASILWTVLSALALTVAKNESLHNLVEPIILTLQNKDAGKPVTQAIPSVTATGMFRAADLQSSSGLNPAVPSNML